MFLPAYKIRILLGDLLADEQLVNLPSWPADLDMYNRSHFSTQRSFQNYLTKHRNELDLLNFTVYDETLFYSDGIKVSLFTP